MRSFRVDIDNPLPEAVEVAADAVVNGEIICYPTDTVYGLGGNALSEEVCRRINRVKGRREDNPLIILIDIRNIRDWISGKDYSRLKPFIERIWPRPVTMIVDPPSVKIPKMLIGPTGGVAIRAVSVELDIQIMKKAGVPLASTSANKTEEPINQVLDSSDDWLCSFCSVLLDAGKIDIATPSTLVDVRGFPEKLIIKRGSAVPFGDFMKAFPDTRIE